MRRAGFAYLVDDEPEGPGCRRFTSDNAKEILREGYYLLPQPFHEIRIGDEGPLIHERTADIGTCDVDRPLLTKRGADAFRTRVTTISCTVPNLFLDERTKNTHPNRREKSSLICSEICGKCPDVRPPLNVECGVNLSAPFRALRLAYEAGRGIYRYVSKSSGVNRTLNTRIADAVLFCKAYLDAVACCTEGNEYSPGIVLNLIISPRDTTTPNK